MNRTEKDHISIKITGHSQTLTDNTTLQMLLQTYELFIDSVKNGNIVNS